MKYFKLIILAMALLLAGTAKAQVSVNVNIGSPPLWGPEGYSDVRYYYLPDVEAYYDIQSSMFIYSVRGTWIHRAYLPSRYQAYDLYGGYKVVMTDYRGDNPYTFFKMYKMKYPKGYHGSSQKNIGSKPGKGNPMTTPSFKGKSVNKGNQGAFKGSGNGNKSMNNGHGNGGGNGGGKGKKK